ncbi:hypothetical protein NMG60_11030005 [Bertholletia excelsa]
MASDPSRGRWGRRPMSMEDEDSAECAEIHRMVKIKEDEEEDLKAYAGSGLKPTKLEVVGWLLYELCSYCILTVLIPMVFPLFISQVMAPEPYRLLKRSGNQHLGENELLLYEGLTKSSISINSLSFSPLEWTSISWVLGLILAAPILSTVSVHLDYGQFQHLIGAAGTAIGALFCLPTGFFKTTWTFPFYIAIILAASTVSSATHVRHLGLLVRGFVGSPIRKSQFVDRQAVAGWLSVFAAGVGCVGSAVIAAFTYHMLKHTEKFLSLWVVSIFSGLLWSIGMKFHLSAVNGTGSNSFFVSLSGSVKPHFLSILKYPHGIGSLGVIFLSNFATMCIFTGSVLFFIGQLRMKPEYLLYLWLIYFIFPLIALPLICPLQSIIKADAVKMQLLGFLLSALISGMGFYHRHDSWRNRHIFGFAIVQSVATGLLHAFGRVLLVDCSPAGKEGLFGAWFSWVRALGACAGFAVASSGAAGRVHRSFAAAFCAAIAGVVVLTFGNVSSFQGSLAAGLVREEGEKGSTVKGLEDDRMEVKGRQSMESVETPCEHFDTPYAETNMEKTVAVALPEAS